MRYRLSIGRVAPAVITCVIGAAAAGGGLALASTGGGTGTISACIHKHGHALYGSPCHKGDRAISWNQVGPRGLSGAPGQNGAAGAAGKDGIGPAYEAMRASGPAIVPFSAGFPPMPQTTVATLAIPQAGSYDIRALTNIRMNGTSGYSVACTLTAGSDSDTGENQSGAEWDAGVGVAAEVLHTFAAAGTATFACASEGSVVGDTWSARGTTIVATQVTSATVTAVTG